MADPLDDNRPFPIQGGYSDGFRPCTIPWWLAEEVYKGYVAKHGSSMQSLESICNRGGFSRGEVAYYIKQTQ